MCFIFLLALFAPRVAFGLMWIFGNRVDTVYGSFIWPLLLLIFLPWTGITYTLLWSPIGGSDGGSGVHGAEWILIIIAVVVDLASWSARVAKQKYAAY
jgi:hypothetical protein